MIELYIISIFLKIFYNLNAKKSQMTLKLYTSVSRKYHQQKFENKNI